MRRTSARPSGASASSARKISKVTKSKPTIEGAGVHLKRAFGFYEVPAFDPFLLLDDFHSDNPAYYLPGFPWHPHRGIETITYVFQGRVEHGDSMGNKGVIGPNEVQWMTAGGGIIHQEMPKGGHTGAMWGCQLWANLPAADKMMAPRYREVKAAEIPEAALKSGVKVKVICGQVEGVRGPEKRGELIDGEGNIHGIAPQRRKAEVVNPRGQRMHDRVPDDPEDLGVPSDAVVAIRLVELPGVDVAGCR